MKKYTNVLVLLLLMVLLAACKNKTKTTDGIEETNSLSHQWTEINMLEFERNCVGFLENENVENAKDYCDCLLETSIEAYPDSKIAMELEQNQIVNLFVNSGCVDDLLLIKIEDPWTDEVSEIFLDNCKEAQKANGIEDEIALSYCTCALGEIKEIIPNPQHVMALTQEELSHIFTNCE